MIASRPFKCFQSIDTLVVYNCRDPSQHTFYLKADGTVVLGLCDARATPPLYRGRTLCWQSRQCASCKHNFLTKRMSWRGDVSKGFAINICAKCKCFSVLFRQVCSVCEWIPGVDDALSHHKCKGFQPFFKQQLQDPSCTEKSKGEFSIQGSHVQKS